MYFLQPDPQNTDVHVMAVDVTTTPTFRRELPGSCSSSRARCRGTACSGRARAATASVSCLLSTFLRPRVEAPFQNATTKTRRHEEDIALLRVFVATPSTSPSPSATSWWLQASSKALTSHLLTSHLLCVDTQVPLDILCRDDAHRAVLTDDHPRHPAGRSTRSRAHEVNVVS